MTVSPRTLTAKIFSAHGAESVEPGSYALLDVDRVMLNDVSGAVAIPEFERIGAGAVFDPARVSCIADHFSPAKDSRSAELISGLRAFAKRYGITDYWEVGATVDAGIEHALLAELGRVRPGDVVLGGDSHTCTSGAFGAFAVGVGSTDIAAALALGQMWVKVPVVHRVTFTGSPGEFIAGKDLVLAYLRRCGVDGATYASLEFGGPALTALGMDDRMALCNMAVEGGAKAGMIAADATTLQWLRGRVEPAELHASAADEGAHYEQDLTIDIDGMPPLVAAPASPGNVHGIGELAGHIRVHQVYVGNCANGSLTDLRQLASIMRGQKVAAGTRLIVVPATQRVYREALVEGLIATLAEAGAMISAPTCGACFGGHNGILAPDEVAVATTNRNFVGRMGDRSSQVYLANAYVAGAAALTGELTDPRAVIATTAHR